MILKYVSTLELSHVMSSIMEEIAFMEDEIAGISDELHRRMNSKGILCTVACVDCESDCESEINRRRINHPNPKPKSK